MLRHLENLWIYHPNFGAANHPSDPSYHISPMENIWRRHPKPAPTFGAADKRQESLPSIPA